jgi:ribosomal-protein-alanine N-acetyltransferase
VKPADLAALHARCFTVPPPFSADSFAGFLESELCFLVAQPQGFALGRVVLDEAELLTLAVDPAHHRAGLGRRLLAAFEAEAAARHATRAFLEVSAENAPAIRLYLSQGYRESGRRRAYYHRQDGPPTDALLMSRELGPA